jgi:hypothetical protein
MKAKKIKEFIDVMTLRIYQIARHPGPQFIVVAGDFNMNGIDLMK